MKSFALAAFLVVPQIALGIFMAVGPDAWWQTLSASVAAGCITGWALKRIVRMECGGGK